MAQGRNGGTFDAANFLSRRLSTLTSIISTEPQAIAMELHGAAVIGPELLDRINSAQNLSSWERANNITMAVYKKVQAEGGEALCLFLEVLKRRRECVGLASSIEQEWRSRGSCAVEPRVQPGTNELSAPDPSYLLPLTDLEINDLSSPPLLEVQPTPVPTCTSQEPHLSSVVVGGPSSCHDHQPHASTPSASSTRPSLPIGQHSACHPDYQEPPTVADTNQYLIENFSQLRLDCKTWYSTPFYTHAKGYKLLLEVSPCDDRVSIRARLLKGEYDEGLPWPMYCNVVVSLVNWKNPDYDAKVGIISFTRDCNEEANSRVLSGESAKLGMGFAEFVSLDELQPEDPNVAYMSEDSIIITVTPDLQVPLSTTGPKPTGQSTTEVVPYTFSVADFSKSREESDIKYSDPFLSHHGGYNLSLQVYPNGTDSGSGTHVSVYALLNKGENDDSLDWPFFADVVVEIVAIDAGENYQQVIHFDSEFGSNVCSRVTQKESAISFGCPQFIAHSILEQGKYVQDEDSLLMYVPEVVIYPSSSVIKHPPWHDSEDNILCGFTVPKFNKHRKYGRTFYSDPFFFPKDRGYKFRCRVCPNGDGNGQSVSCYVERMKGEYDAECSWPFRVKILIEILNWLGNKNHVQRGVTFDVEGDVATDSVECACIISHDDLPLIHSKGTRYIQDDCVYWRIREAPPNSMLAADKVGKLIGKFSKISKQSVVRVYKTAREYFDQL